MILAKQNIFLAARATLHGKYYADTWVTLNTRTAPVAFGPHTISHLVFLISLVLARANVKRLYWKYWTL